MISEFVQSGEDFFDRYILNRPDFRPRSVQTDGIRGARFGSLAHTVVEQWLENGMTDAAAIIEQHLEDSRFRANREARELLRSMISELESSVLSDLVKQYEIRTEVPLLVQIGESVLIGSADLVLENDAGEYRIIDLKSDVIDGASDIEKKTEQYRYQLLSYAYALNKSRGKPPEQLALYFLRTGDLVDVPGGQSALTSLGTVVGDMQTYVAERSGEVV